MEYLEYKDNYPKEAHEVGLALKQVAIATGEVLKDGFQAGQDTPVIITSAFTNLAMAIQGLDKMPEEFKEEPVKATMGILAPIASGVQSLLKDLKKQN